MAEEFDERDYCRDCDNLLTLNEINENIDLCHKCFDKHFEED